MRAAAILGLGSSTKALQPFQEAVSTEWLIGLPEHHGDADVILIFGGDGTIHRHLAQLLRLQRPVLVVPCGSGNDFARALNLGRIKDSLLAWRRFADGDGNVRSIDLGVITPINAGRGTAPTGPHYFCCIAGVGLDTEVARRANRLPRWIRGHGGYALSLLPAWLRFTPAITTIEVTNDGQPGRYPTRSHRPLLLAAFANAPSYGGGMRIAPRAQLDDGKLDVCLVSQLPLLKLARLFPRVFFGKHLEVPEVEYFQAEQLHVASESPIEVYADGEYVCRTPAKIGIAPGALQVVCGGP